MNLICKVLEINAEDILDYGKQVDNKCLLFFHLSVLAFLIIPLGNIILPLILWMNKKDKIIGLKELGVNVLNFQIFWSVLTTISVITFALLKILHYGNYDILFYIFVGLYAINIILPIYFAIETNNGKINKLYPNIIKLIK